MNKQQLANRIWASANKMRSKIDANEYKDYILGLIFYKFLSDNEVNYLMKNGWPEDELVALVEDNEDPDAKITLEFCQRNIGYFISYKNLFSTWLKPDVSFSVADLSVALSDFDRLISDLYRPVYSGIFKTLQAGLTKLGDSTTSQTKALKDLIKLIKDIPTDGSQDYDVLGYVYEYLIGNFAANAGKKAGEFYTPHEVAILMSEIVAEHHKAKDKIEIYDPTSGSGSLLITIGKSVGRHIEDKNRVKYYAQELKENTYNLTRMNLVMRGIQPNNINTRCADSLDEDWPVKVAGTDIGQPLYVDAVVSNPPYSQHWDPTDREMDARFQNYGVAPKSKADYAFLLHELHHLKPDGILTIVLPHGVLFRGDKDDDGEGKIRMNLIEKNHIDAIIGLPANIFFGTSIPTLIMVLKQHRENDDVLIIDASKGFVKDGKNNKLRACDIKKIADTVRDRKTIPGFSRCVSRDEIRHNGYNLNIPRYVDSSEPETKFDIYATVFGGIPDSEIDELRPYWEAFPSLRDELFESEADRPYSTIRVENVARTVSDNADVLRFKSVFENAFEGFEEELHDLLVTRLDSVKDLKAQDTISRSIFRRLKDIPLIDQYAVFQSLAENWASITNDIEMIQSEGFDAARTVEVAYKLVKRNDEEIEVSDGLKGRILPFDLVQSVMFENDLKEIEKMQERIEEIDCELDDIISNMSPEDQEAYLNDDNTKFDKNSLKAGIKEAFLSVSTPEVDLLRRYLSCAGKKEKVAFIEANPSTVWGMLAEPYKKSVVTKTINDLCKDYAFPVDSIEHFLVTADRLIEEQAGLNTDIKTAQNSIEQKTVEAIRNFTDPEIEDLLHRKWITPVIDSNATTLGALLDCIVKSIVALDAKYSTPLNDLRKNLSVAKTELSELILSLSGDRYSIEGLMQL